jgi:hypothetical protein
MMMTNCVSCVLMGRGIGVGLDVATLQTDLPSFAGSAKVYSYEQNGHHKASSTTIGIGSPPDASYAIRGVIS